MNIKTIVVKNQGQRPSELFDEEKLRQSIVSTCRSLRVPEGQAEEISKIVARSVDEWASGKSEITSNDIRRIGADKLAKYHVEAAYIYKQRLTVL